MVKHPADRTKNIIILDSSCFNFLKRGDDQKVNPCDTCMYIMWSLHWSASSNPRSVLSYFNQSRDRVCVTCHDVMTQVFRVWWWPSLHKSRSPDSLYAALLVIRSSVKLSIAKTQDIGWLGDAWNYKFPAFYLNPRVAQPTIADRIQTQIWKTLLASGKSLPVSVSHPD